MTNPVPIDEILSSIKKMMENKSSRVNTYLMDQARERSLSNEDCNSDEDDTLELTELAEENLSYINDNNKDANSNDSNLKSDNTLAFTEQSTSDYDTEEDHEGQQSQSKLVEDADAKAKDDQKNDKIGVSEKTCSEASMYLKYLREKSDVVRDKNKSKTVEEFLMDAAMPYMVDWLDKNLGRLVKDAVDKEIKKITKDEN